MVALVAFWHVWGNVILTILFAALPSVIVGLTPNPKAAGVVKALSFALQLLSILTHKDAPGTFKLPMTVQK